MRFSLWNGAKRPLPIRGGHGSRIGLAAGRVGIGLYVAVDDMGTRRFFGVAGGAQIPNRLAGKEELIRRVGVVAAVAAAVSDRSMLGFAGKPRLFDIIMTAKTALHDRIRRCIF